MQRQINRVDKVVWEMLKHTRIIEQHELEEQNEKQDSNKKGFLHTSREFVLDHHYEIMF
jgi:hypothetical protein